MCLCIHAGVRTKMHALEYVSLMFCIAINATYPAGHLVLSLLVLMAFNVGFGCIAGILTMIEV